MAIHCNDRRKYRGGKVSAKKRHYQISLKYRMGRSKRSMIKYVQRIVKRLEERTEEVNKLFTPAKPTEVCRKDLCMQV